MKKTLLTLVAATIVSASGALAEEPIFHPIADADYLSGGPAPEAARQVDTIAFNPIADADLLSGGDSSSFTAHEVSGKYWCNALADADQLAGQECPVKAARDAHASAGH